MQYKDLNDFELVYYVRENDDESLKLLYEKYVPIIKSICKKYYNRYKNIGIDFDDLYQEAYIAFYRAVQTYNDTDCLFYTYLTVCIERKVITYCKKYNSIKNYPLNLNVGDELLDTILASSKNDAEQIILENEKFFEIKNFLSFNLSVVYELRYNNFSYKEIATLLDVPRSTVDGRLSQIRKKIRNNFDF